MYTNALAAAGSVPSALDPAVKETVENLTDTKMDGSVFDEVDKVSTESFAPKMDDSQNPFYKNADEDSTFSVIGSVIGGAIGAFLMGPLGALFGGLLGGVLDGKNDSGENEESKLPDILQQGLPTTTLPTEDKDQQDNNGPINTNIPNLPQNVDLDKVICDL